MKQTPHAAAHRATKWLALAASAVFLVACSKQATQLQAASMSDLDLKSTITIESNATIKYKMLFDNSKIALAKQAQNKDKAQEVAQSYRCDSLAERIKSEYDCKDLELGQFEFTGEQAASPENGVTFNPNDNQVTVDVIKLFESTSGRMRLLPMTPLGAQESKARNLAVSMALTMPANVASVNGVPFNDNAQHIVLIDLYDTAGYERYMVTGEISSNKWKWYLGAGVLAALALLAAFWLVRRKIQSK